MRFSAGACSAGRSNFTYATCAPAAACAGRFGLLAQVAGSHGDSSGSLGGRSQPDIANTVQTHTTRPPARAVKMPMSDLLPGPQVSSLGSCPDQHASQLDALIGFRPQRSMAQKVMLEQGGGLLAPVQSGLTISLSNSIVKSPSMDDSCTANHAAVNVA